MDKKRMEVTRIQKHFSCVCVKNIFESKFFSKKICSIFLVCYTIWINYLYILYLTGRTIEDNHRYKIKMTKLG